MKTSSGKKSSPPGNDSSSDSDSSSSDSSSSSSDGINSSSRSKDSPPHNDNPSESIPLNISSNTCNLSDHQEDVDSDDSVKDKDYVPDPNELHVSDIEVIDEEYTNVAGRKRKRNPSKWNQSVAKMRRNSGKSYLMHGNERVRPERKIKPPCSDKCKLECVKNIDEQERMKIFEDFWALNSLDKQRNYIAALTSTVQTKYRYVREGGSNKRRAHNVAYHFKITVGDKIRVCKTFFKNTLDINDRPIRTVLEKKNKVAQNVLEEDLRGKHGNHKTVDEDIRKGIKDHINSIPRVESHYLRAHTTRSFIDGSRSIADIHRDYVQHCKENDLPFGNYTLFYRIFTEEFNISFFTPKKDQCDLCFEYGNATIEAKEALKERYDNHLIEKQLSRNEKINDKANNDAVVAVYDLQAVLQLPKGDISLFYYKSKLNVLNLTIYDIKTNKCECYVWDETNGNRGVNEIGSCVLDYISEINENRTEKEIIFWSDNCAGQQKNKFMIALYLYAVNRFENIHAITHKFLIKGHTQNEGDSAHSLIERQMKRLLKSGPIYVPESFVTAIRMARKTGTPFSVHEMMYSDF